MQKNSTLGAFLRPVKRLTPVHLKLFKNLLEQSEVSQNLKGRKEHLIKYMDSELPCCTDIHFECLISLKDSSKMRKHLPLCTRAL